jgi:uracil-DNA glycosylase
VKHCKQIARDKRRAFLEWEYWGKPVPNFGDENARLLIVGLAPAAHGGNRTGRVFTGDRSGDWLFRSMHKAGFANQATSEKIGDGLRLNNAYITAVAHCAPPLNKLTPREVVNCHDFFEATLKAIPARVYLVLGQIAWTAFLKEAKAFDWLEEKPAHFGHGVEVRLKGDRTLLASYHPSQQNTFTGRLTEEMLDRVFYRARELC